MIKQLLDDCVVVDSPMNALIVLASNDTIKGAIYTNTKTFKVSSDEPLVIKSPHYATACDIAFGIWCEHPIHVEIGGTRYPVTPETVIPHFLINYQEVVYVIEPQQGSTHTTFSCSEAMLGIQARRRLREKPAVRFVHFFTANGMAAPMPELQS